jgi:hypothetical protein
MYASTITPAARRCPARPRETRPTRRALSQTEGHESTTAPLLLCDRKRVCVVRGLFRAAVAPRSTRAVPAVDPAAASRPPPVLSSVVCEASEPANQPGSRLKTPGSGTRILRNWLEPKAVSHEPAHFFTRSQRPERDRATQTSAIDVASRTKLVQRWANRPAALAACRASVSFRSTPISVRHLIEP